VLFLTIRRAAVIKRTKDRKVNSENGTDRGSPPRVLFVCLANLCRSPMAEVIVKTLHEGVLEADSAGVSPVPGPVFAEMAAVVWELYGADMSRHHPRHVLEFPIAEYDCIVAMDSAVFIRLSEMPEIPHDRLLGWEVADPAGLGFEAYEQTAFLIEENIDQLLERIGAGT
jgi:protein-tyrosine phosphatase